MSVFPKEISTTLTTFKSKGGLTKRELFAAMILQGFAGSDEGAPTSEPKHMARRAVAWADALIEELAKPKKETP